MSRSSPSCWIIEWTGTSAAVTGPWRPYGPGIEERAVQPPREISEGVAVAEDRLGVSDSRLDTLDVALEQRSRATDDRRRAECMARIQTDAVQLALDLLVREPDIAGFFRVFIKSLVEESREPRLRRLAARRRRRALRAVDGVRATERFFTADGDGLGRA